MRIVARGDEHRVRLRVVERRAPCRSRLFAKPYLSAECLALRPVLVTTAVSATPSAPFTFGSSTRARVIAHADEGDAELVARRARRRA